MLEVGRLHRRAIGVLQPLSEPEVIRHPVRRDLGEPLGQPRDQVGAPLALGVPVGEQGRVDQPHRLPPVDGVAHCGVERVRLSRLRDGDGATGLAVVTTGEQDQRQRNQDAAAELGLESSTSWREQLAHSDRPPNPASRSASTSSCQPACDVAGERGRRAPGLRRRGSPGPRPCSPSTTRRSELDATACRHLGMGQEHLPWARGPAELLREWLEAWENIEYDSRT